MKIFVALRGQAANSTRSAARGFTLPELLVAVAIFSMVLTGVVFAHLYGLSMFRFTEAKLNATDDSRKVIGKITQEIRGCRTTAVGNISHGVFVGLLDGQKQQGSALMIRPSTNTSQFIIYFVNQADQTFRRTTSTPGSAVILADFITNSVAFSARNYLGTVLTNNQNNRVIHINLEAYKPQSYLQLADYYKLETSATRRALE